MHTSPATKWRGSLVDPDLLKSDAGRRELSAIAERYYQVTHDSIRRYDPNHLILGDRWEANAALPEQVVRAALPYVDVLSFQCFGTMEGLYDWDGNPKPGLVEAVREANKEIYERATQPYGSDELTELDEKLCRVRDEAHKHVR